MRADRAVAARMRKLWLWMVDIRISEQRMPILIPCLYPVCIYIVDYVCVAVDQLCN